MRGPVELVYDLENPTFDLCGLKSGRQKATDSKMCRTTRLLGYLRVGGFLDAVVEKPIGALRVENESGLDRVPEVREQLFARTLGGSCQQGVLCAVAEASK
jgi:hypothetical protein